MEVRTDSKNGAPVASSAETVKVFQVETQARKDQWAEHLQDNPDDFAEIEQQIDQHYRQGAGQLVASLLAEVTNHPQMDEHTERIRRNSLIPLRVPEPRPLKIRLLCGLMLWFGYDGFINTDPEMMEHRTFNQVGFGLLLFGTAWYGIKGYREWKEDQDA